MSVRANDVRAGQRRVRSRDGQVLLVAWVNSRFAVLVEDARANTALPIIETVASVRWMPIKEAT